jgi:stearoyl-CoA desaturase (Delta-9 desaturase)
METAEAIRGVLKASPAARRYQRTVAFLIVVVPFAGVLAAASAWWGGHVTALDLGLLAAFYCLTIFGVTAGFHRHFAHRAFDAPPAVRWALGILGSMAGQGPLLFWVATHRRHHAFSDRPGDPHSPHVNGGQDTDIWRGLWHAHLGWMFSDEITSWPHFAADHMRDKLAFAINSTYFVWILLGLALPAALGGLASGTWTGALGGLLWGGLVRMFLVNHVCWCVGSVCHVFGARRFDNRDHSANNYLVALLSFGEGLQNNHHAFPGSANHRVTWWEPDLSGWLIQGLKWLGGARAVHVPSAEEIQRVRLAGQRTRVGVNA